MRQTYDISLTCSCGASLRFTSPFSSEVRREREAFDEAHASCRVAAGPCWHDPGVDWPSGIHPRCELPTGHTGAPECSRGIMGGVAIWGDDEAANAPESHKTAPLAPSEPQSGQRDHRDDDEQHSGDRCQHDWMDRGSPGDHWQECYLCGGQRATLDERRSGAES